MTVFDDEEEETPMPEPQSPAPAAPAQPAVQPKVADREINWKSRKFILAVIGVIAMAYLASQGNIPWKEAANHITWIVMFYAVGEGLADHGQGKQIIDLVSKFLNGNGPKP